MLTRQRTKRAAKPLAALDFFRPTSCSLGRGERATVGVDLLQRAAAADGHAHQRVVRDVHGDARLSPEALVEVPQERPATREDHPPVHDVRSELGWGAVQGVPHGREDRVDGDAYGLPDLLAGYDHGLGQPRDEVPAPDLGRLLLVEPEGAAELDLELFGGLGADGELVLLLYVGGDRIVDIVAGYADGGFGHDTAEGDYGDLARPAADVDDHRPLSLVDGQARPYGRRKRFLDGVSLTGPRRLCRLLDGPELDARHTRGYAHDDPRTDQRPEEQAL